MNPQCIECGKVVALKAGITTEITTSKPVFDRDDCKAYLCISCSPSKLDVAKSFPWYKSHRTV